MKAGGVFPVASAAGCDVEASGGLRDIQSGLFNREGLDGLFLAAIKKLKIFLAEVIDRFPFPVTHHDANRNQVALYLELKGGCNVARGDFLRSGLHPFHQDGNNSGARHQDGQCQPRMTLQFPGVAGKGVIHSIPSESLAS